WLPTAALYALSWYMIRPYQELIFSHPGQNPFLTHPQLARTYFLFQVANLVIAAIVSVGVTKEVLGLRRGFRFFYAGFGAAELRVIVGYFAFILLFVVIVIGLVLGTVLAGRVGTAVLGAALSAAHVDPAVSRLVIGLAVFALLLAAWLALILIFVRLTFLFLPVTVAEKRIGILRSWELTQGNFWRIFLIAVLVFLPLGILLTAAFVAWLGSEYFEFVRQHLRDPVAVQAYVVKRMLPL